MSVDAISILPKLDESTLAFKAVKIFKYTGLENKKRSVWIRRTLDGNKVRLGFIDWYVNGELEEEKATVEWNSFY